MSESAARVTSSVVHVSSTATKLGTGAGFAAVGVIALLTGGIGVIAAAGIVSTGMSAGTLVDQYSGLDDSEKIISGAEHVFLDEPKHQAANASENTRTDQHDGHIVTGSDSVFIERFPASRRHDEVECSGPGRISSGSEHIFYGGGDSRAPQDVGQSLPFVWRALGIITSITAMSERPTSLWQGVNWLLDARGVKNAVQDELRHSSSSTPSTGLLDSADAIRAPITTMQGLIDAGGRVAGALSGK